MDYEAVLAQVLALLQREKRLSYRCSSGVSGWMTTNWKT
jgi:hypothetical protein